MYALFSFFRSQKKLGKICLISKVLRKKHCPKLWKSTFSGQSEYNFSIFGRRMQGSVDTMRGSVDTMQGSFDTMQGSFDTMQGSFDTMQVSFHTMQGSFDKDTGTHKARAFVSRSFDMLLVKLF